MLMFLFFVYAGRNIDKSKHPWQYIWLCSIVFTIVLGCRYMRGNDYLRFQMTFMYDQDKTEVLFTFINRFLRWVGVTKYTFLCAYSLPFILCGLYFCKRYVSLSKFLYPAFLLAFIFFDEYCIRQALGFSFIFIYMVVLFNMDEEECKLRAKIRNFLLLIVCALAAVSIHSVNALNVVFITAIFIVLRGKCIPWFISIPSFLVSSFVLSNSIDWSLFQNSLSYLGNFSEKFYIYTTRANSFFSSDAFQNDYTRSVGGKILECFGHCSLFYLGCKTIKKIPSPKSIVALYNIYVIGSIIDMCFWNYELLRRVFDPMLAFWCFSIAFVLENASKLKYTTQEKFMFLGLLYFPYEMGFKYLVERGQMTLFLWDM
jgi:hypothetical protein